MSWPVVPLEKIARVSGGSTPKRSIDSYWSGNIPWVTPTDLPPPGSMIAEVEDTKDHITEEGLNSCSVPLLQTGTVLFSSRATIGKIGIASRPVATNQGFANFTPGSGVHSKYLAYALQHFTPQIAALAGSTTFKEVSRGAFRKFRIPLPTLSEQQRCVEILDEVNVLRRKSAEAKEKAQHILPALFIKMFGDPATNPMGWKTGILGDVLSETQYGISTKSDADGTGTPILRMNNIDVCGRVDLSNLKYVVLDKTTLEKYRLASGDILFNRTNSKELVGKTGLWRGEMEAVPASYLIRIRVNQERADPEFIWTLMNSRFMKQALFDKARRAIGMANINARELRSLPIVIPDIGGQEKFGQFSRNVLDQVECLGETDRFIKRLTQVLMHRAFSGNLTAKWRKAHADELLREAEEQVRMIECAGTNESGWTERGRPRKVASC